MRTRQRRWPRVGAAALGLCLAFQVGSAAAGALGVLPVRISLAPDGRPATVRLENHGSAPSLVQVESFAWRDGGDAHALEPTDELIALPAVFALGAGEERIIRVALRRPGTLAREATYRLIVTEVPQEVRPAGGGVSFAVRMSLPVFVTPPAAIAEPTWRVVDGRSGARLVIANQGGAHLRLSSLTLQDEAGDKLFTSSDVAYVLAGEERVWTLPASGSGSAAPRRLRVETEQGPLEVPLAAPGT